MQLDSILERVDCLYAHFALTSLCGVVVQTRYCQAIVDSPYCLLDF